MGKTIRINEEAPETTPFDDAVNTLVEVLRELHIAGEVRELPTQSNAMRLGSAWASRRQQVRESAQARQHHRVQGIFEVPDADGYVREMTQQQARQVAQPPAGGVQLWEVPGDD